MYSFIFWIFQIIFDIVLVIWILNWNRINKLNIEFDKNVNRVFSDILDRLEVVENSYTNFNYDYAEHLINDTKDTSFLS